MSVQAFKNLNHGVKEAQESVLFTLFTNRGWFEGFNAHPLHYFFMPILGLTFLINASLDWYHFKKAMNKNLELLMMALASTLSALGAITAIAGTLMGHALGFSFFLGPYFFIAALGVGMVVQSSLFALNGYRAYMAPSGSEYRRQHVQSMISQLLILTTLLAIIASVIVVMVVPGGPVISAAIAGAAVALTLVNLGWRAMPTDSKEWFKKAIGLSKPIEPIDVQRIKRSQKDIHIEPHATSHLFAEGYRKHYVQELLTYKGRDAAVDYLNQTIKIKLDALMRVDTSKAQSKRSVLNILSNALNDDKKLFTKKELNQRYPHVFQSLLRYKGDVEDIYDAVVFMRESTKPGLTANLR